MAKATQPILASIEIDRNGQAWAHVIWGSGDKVVIQISTKHVPSINWTSDLLKEVDQALQTEGKIIASALVK
jgi:hypothetical protein